MTRNPIIATLSLCTLALVLSHGRAEAQTKPFKISGAGIAPNGLPLPGQGSRPHWAVGTATQLGLYHGSGTVETDTAEFHADGSITGQFGSGVLPFDFVGANGDVLSCEYGRTEFGASTPGTFTLVPMGAGVYVAYFIAEFVPQGDQCTGKFASVTGSWIMYAATEPFVLGSTDPIPYSWEGSGSLTFKPAKK